MKLLILDNYDSFTYNLVHLVEKVSDISFDVVKNDRIDVDAAGKYEKILISPGPGLPANAGIVPALISKYHTSRSILGVCLGLQAIGEAFHCKLKNLDMVYHGVAQPVNIISDDPLFSGCPKRFNVGRYHSWVIDEEKIHDDLVITATDDQALIMAARHARYDVRGVQFHPESILSEYGENIIRNWLNIPQP
jgi:anthranilate synthase component 2